MIQYVVQTKGEELLEEEVSQLRIVAGDSMKMRRFKC